MDLVDRDREPSNWYPKVAEAAAIGLKHPKWDERPLLVIVPKKGEHPTRDDILTFLGGKMG